MRIRQVAAIALILGGAVGCTSGGSGGATTGPTSAAPTSSAVTTTPTAPSTSASPTPTVATTGPNVRPGEKPPTLASVGRTNSPVGSIIFASYWIQTVDWAYATMNSGLARSVLSSTCTGCSRLLSLDIDKVATNGSYYRGGRIAVVESTIQPNVPHFESDAIVDVTVDQAALTLHDRTGKITSRSPDSGKVTFRTWIRYYNHHWVVVDWKQAVVK